MIPANELQIGSLVLYEGKEYEITFLAGGFCALSGEFSSSRISYDNIYGVPLTREILDRMWFKKTLLEDDGSDYCSLDLSDDNFIDLSFVEDFESGVCELYLFPYDSDAIKFQYAHQVQLLYVAIKKEPLKIKS